ASDVATLCGLLDADDPVFNVRVDTLLDNLAKAQKALGFFIRSLYQAKHTYAVISLLEGESPASSRAVSEPRSRRSRSTTQRPFRKAEPSPWKRHRRFRMG